MKRSTTIKDVYLEDEKSYKFVWPDLTKQHTLFFSTNFSVSELKVYTDNKIIDSIM